MLTVVGCVLLASDELFRMEQLPVRTRPHLVNHIRLEVHVHAAWHVLAVACLGEKRAKSVFTARPPIRRESPVRLPPSASLRRWRPTSMPCSRQYSCPCQRESCVCTPCLPARYAVSTAQRSAYSPLPICVPACPTWMEMTSLMASARRVAGRAAFRHPKPCPNPSLVLTLTLD